MEARETVNAQIRANRSRHPHFQIQRLPRSVVPPGRSRADLTSISYLTQQLDIQAPFSYANLHPDPFEDLFRAMGETYDSQPTSAVHFTPHQQPPHLPPPHLPLPQLDANTLAWLQLLQAQGQGQLPPAPAFSPTTSGNRNRGEGTSQGNTQAAPGPSDDGNEDDEEQSGGDGVAVVQDKRRRNTAASGSSKSASMYCLC